MAGEFELGAAEGRGGVVGDQEGEWVGRRERRGGGGVSSTQDGSRFEEKRKDKKRGGEVESQTGLRI